MFPDKCVLLGYIANNKTIICVGIVTVVIYEALYFDVAQGRINGALNERVWSQNEIEIRDIIYLYNIKNSCMNQNLFHKDYQK